MFSERVTARDLGKLGQSYLCGVTLTQTDLSPPSTPNRDRLHLKEWGTVVIGNAVSPYTSSAGATGEQRWLSYGPTPAGVGP